MTTKTFNTFLAEMAIPDAVKLFGLNQNWGMKELNFAYRKAAMKWHPDRPSGSTEKMKEINDAKDTLARYIENKDPQWLGNNPSGKPRQTYADHKEELREFGKKINHVFVSIFKPVTFTNYFSNLFPGEKFTATIMKNYQRERPETLVGYDWRFENATKDKVFDLSYYVFLSSVKGESVAITGSSNSADIFYQMTIKSYGLVAGKKVKMAQQDYKSTNLTTALTDPSIAFPKAKVLKDQSKRKFSKRDMELLMKTQLKSESIDNDTYMIPINNIEGGYLKVYRSVIMRYPSWTIYSIYMKERYTWKQSSAKISVLSLPESEDTIEFLKDLQKNAKSDADVARMLQNKHKNTFKT